ncbi:MAG: hypothetical protein QN163_07545 [Armatimonadota bacterium]|nr:hypothetical protein [Armatimonadota bacterium]MDR5696173.1 hypothetical protein [Armatimonadota bacterium]
MRGHPLVDVIGWTGAAALLAAYALVSTRRLGGASVPYQLLNAFGSVLLGINSVYYGAFPSAFVNTIWLGIAVYALHRARAVRR